MCQDLRVLNSIRDYQIGIPLTFTQYPPWGRQEGRLWSLAGSANPLPSVPALAGELGCNGMGRGGLRSAGLRSASPAVLSCSLHPGPQSRVSLLHSLHAAVPSPLPVMLSQPCAQVPALEMLPGGGGHPARVACALQGPKCP